jgi:hypothetical protein
MVFHHLFLSPTPYLPPLRPHVHRRFRHSRLLLPYRTSSSWDIDLRRTRAIWMELGMALAMEREYQDGLAASFLCVGDELARDVVSCHLFVAHPSGLDQSDGRADWTYFTCCAVVYRDDSAIQHGLGERIDLLRYAECARRQECSEAEVGGWEEWKWWIE